MGTAFISSLAVKQEIDRGELVALPVKGIDIRREFHLVSRADAFLSPAARAFRELAAGGGPRPGSPRRRPDPAKS
jgi:DNA-binding transcriptional LysR family regulator